MADYPLPLDTVRAFRAAERGCRNFGLLYDRYVGYSPDWSLEGSYKQNELKKLIEACNRWANEADYKVLYWGLRTRMQAVMRDTTVQPFVAAPEWRLVVGLGKESPFETGLTLHPVYGCPVVPGTALKGMTRAWAEAVSKPEAERTTFFGTQLQSGDAVFFDAIPFTPPMLALDVLNPHYPEYYREGRKQPPADWQSPVPVYFITVAAGTKFLFGVGSRTNNAQNAKTARDWLQRALRDMGVGGKTTSGYGYWSDIQDLTGI